jgi:hypothetical protein
MRDCQLAGPKGARQAESRDRRRRIADRLGVTAMALYRQGKRNRAAFERGLEVLHAGLEARRRS